MASTVILGTGIDLVDVGRIRNSCERFGRRFMDRILHEAEIAYCQSYRDPAPFLAARFAAKEAIAKAFGTGIGGQLGWHDLEVGREPSGRPFVLLHGRGKALLEAAGGRSIQLSLSHTAQHAIAMAILQD